MADLLKGDKVSALKKVAIVGGETHIGEVTKLVGVRLEIVGAAVREDQFDKARQDFGGHITKDWRKLLDQAKPEIVAVANENDLKAEVCLEALQRGMHVIVDKPLALTLEDTRAISDAAERSGKGVLMLLTLRGDPFYRKVREIVLSGEIGEPVQIYGKMSVQLKADKRPPWFLDRRRAGGPILDLASHGIDQFEWATGRKLVEVTAHEANLSRPDMPHLTDSGAMFFRLDNRGTAFIEQNRLMPEGQGSDYRMRVVGTEGQVDMRMGKCLWQQTETGRTDFDINDLGPSLSVVESWLDAMDKGSENLVPDEASFRVNEICCVAIEAAKQNTALALPA